MIDKDGIDKSPVKKALDEVVKTTISETAESAQRMLEPRRHDINEKRCGHKLPCRCIEPPSPWTHHYTTPYGPAAATFDLAALPDRVFWSKFCERNNDPLGYLAGIRAMQLVQEVESLKKELELANGVIEKLKEEKIKIGKEASFALNQAEKKLKESASYIKGIVLNSHEGMYGRII